VAIVVYLAIPMNAQVQVNQALATAIQTVLSLFTVVQLAATSATAAGKEHSDETVSMTDVANKLISQEVQEEAEVRKLVALAARDNDRRITHIRYFIRCPGARPA
jgi:uncharacterized protein YpuA (DUF1002 family)